MAIAITHLGISAPDGAVIGLIGETGSGVEAVLEASRNEGALTFDHAQLGAADVVERSRMAGQLFDLRRAGGVAFLASHEDELLRRLVDEIWWIHDGKLASKGESWRRSISTSTTSRNVCVSWAADNRER